MIEEDVARVLKQISELDTAHLDIPLLQVIASNRPVVLLTLARSAKTTKEKMHTARLLALLGEKSPKDWLDITRSLILMSRLSKDDDEVQVFCADALNRAPMIPLIRGHFERLRGHRSFDVRRIVGFGLAKHEPPLKREKHPPKKTKRVTSSPRHGGHPLPVPKHGTGKR